MEYYFIFLPLVEVNSLNSLILNTPIFNISNGKDEKSSLPFLLPDTCRTKQILKPFNYILMVDNELNLTANPAIHQKFYLKNFSCEPKIAVQFFNGSQILQAPPAQSSSISACASLAPSRVLW